MKISMHLLHHMKLMILIWVQSCVKLIQLNFLFVMEYKLKSDCNAEINFILLLIAIFVGYESYQYHQFHMMQQVHWYFHDKFQMDIKYEMLLIMSIIMSIYANAMYPIKLLIISLIAIDYNQDVHTLMKVYQCNVKCFV